MDGRHDALIELRAIAHHPAKELCRESARGKCARVGRTSRPSMHSLSGSLGHSAPGYQLMASAAATLVLARTYAFALAVLGVPDVPERRVRQFSPERFVKMEERNFPALKLLPGPMRAAAGARDKRAWLSATCGGTLLVVYGH